MLIPTLKQLRDGANVFATRRGQQRSAIGRPLAAGVALVVLLLGISGCASGGGGAMSDSVWREDLGRQNPETIEDALTKIMQKHSLQLDQRFDVGREIRWELTWIPREVVADEEVRGINNARNRIVIRGVQSGIGELDNYRMTWELENEVTTLTDSNWRPDTVPASVRDEFRRVYSDLELEVRTGLRR